MHTTTKDEGAAHNLLILHQQIAKSIKLIGKRRETNAAAKRFKANAIRISHAAALPWNFIHDYLIYGYLMVEANRFATNGRDWRSHELTGEQQRLAGREFRRLYAEMRKKNARKAAIDRGLGLSKAHSAFSRIFRRMGPEQKNGVVAVMATVIVGSWTAFEALAEDLWVAILNSRPQLALLAMDAEIKESDKPETKKQKQDVCITLPLWKTIDPKFKVCEHMGDILREYRRDWARRGDPLKSYEKVFPNSRREIQSIFLDKRLGWLRETRNAIVHDGAIAETQFVAEVHAHPRLKHVEKGQPIPIDGGLARELGMSRIQAGVSLLNFVNTWLNDHP